MDRRLYIKSVFGLAVAGAASFSILKWVSMNRAVVPADLVHKRELLAELAELIIPQTDTPGARAAMVHDYMIMVILNCTPVKEQNKFIDGIAELEDYTAERYGKDFLQCSLAEKKIVLKHMARNSSGYSYKILNKINNKLFGKPFFLKLRELTVEGYCQSRLGATQGLAYDYIPHTFEACIPLRKNQKSWATK
ncbi:gluconate 2-dehydrogenase subunit 3 family protein [Pedobacter cryoconitis]|uniref:Gluconate 2-dehydrogenase subunit 3-like protein n=1 Tax=Pedobacter cryoconitis TaxID=188932 RepID=A0A327S1I2_9SPHI|nr:gluconate 2-dehydrogenase subunit 3 family protein [Pedobacter cryoconitis]RAJ22849.1 gluconate 2-dehydrogenase subunit 3-like protein [Pedobacter cryoconitis]